MIKNNKRSLLLVIYFIMTSCSMNCVEPGLQSRSASININVPVHKIDKKIKIHWVDSGQIINKNEKIKFNIRGSINFCPHKKNKNPKKVLVPAVFCSDGMIPNYDKAANINDVSNNYGVDEKNVSENELCSGKGFGSNRHYINTGVKVNPGDKLSFNLVARDLTIDYDNLQEKISFDDNCYKTETGNEKVLPNEILNINEKKGKKFFCDNKDGKRNRIKFLPIDETKIKKRKVLVGNGYTPYDNKIHFNKSFIKDDDPWINGALLDLRKTKSSLNELCKEKKNCNLDNIKKYESYEINCYYQNICYTKKGVWNNFDNINEESNKNCVSSIRYKKYDANNGKCNIYSHLAKIENEIKKIKENKISSNFVSTLEEDIENISWAEALVARIGSFDHIKEAELNKKNDISIECAQCIPKRKSKDKKQLEYDRCNYDCLKISDDFKDFSLRLNFNYKVNEDIPNNSDVMLAIADHNLYEASSRGGYHVEITRSCEYVDGQKLYIYLGNNDPPKDFSNVGTDDFKKVGIKDKYGKSIILDVISGEHFKDQESKKIYFGIDLSNVEKEDIMDEEGKFYKNNEYNISLFINKRINNFISSNINKILDFIKEEIIGNNIKDLYKGYAKDLLQGVRALLILYIIFTVLGYMFGITRLNQFDFIIRIIKIAFISFAFSDKSWEVFSATLSKLFMDGSSYLIDSFSGYAKEGGKKFEFLDFTAGALFTWETWIKFLSLILVGPFGFIAFLMIFYSSFVLTKCIINATFRYVLSTALAAFLLSLTPLFIIFILFQQTKSLFDNWIRTIAHITVQPMILFLSLSILNQLIYSVLYNLTNFSACYQCLIKIKFLSYDFCIMKSVFPLGYSPDTSIDGALNYGTKANMYFAMLPIDLIQIIIYFITAKAMEAFISTSETMAQAIFSASYGIIGGISQIINNVSQTMFSNVEFFNNDKHHTIIFNEEKMKKDRTKIRHKLPKNF